MRQLDKVATALAGALGFSTKHTEARLKVICQGNDKDAQEVVVIIECRIQQRRGPVENSDEEETTKKKKRGLKPVGNPKTPHKSLLQSLAKQEARRSG